MIREKQTFNQNDLVIRYKNKSHINKGPGSDVISEL